MECDGMDSKVLSNHENMKDIMQGNKPESQSKAIGHGAYTFLNL